MYEYTSPYGGIKIINLSGDRHWLYRLRVRVMVFNITFNNISVIWVEKTGVPRENHQPAASHWKTLWHNVVSSTPWVGFELTLVVIGTDCIGSYKSIYHTIKTTTAPLITVVILLQSHTDIVKILPNCLPEERRPLL